MPTKQDSHADAFSRLQERTLCPFAEGARIWRSPAWDNSLSVLTNYSIIARELGRFVLFDRAATLHGFCAEVRLGAAACDFESVRVGFRDLLFGLASEDESCRRCLAADVLAPDWQFEFSGMRMFLNVFAPCYPFPHSKWIPDRDLFLVFFQPEHSFDLCGINSSEQETKAAIRRRFADAGMPYNGELIDARSEALLYMFPCDPFGPPVRWWL